MLRPWIPLEELNWDYLSSNPGAINLLKSNPNKINWSELSRNPKAIDLLSKNKDKINWNNLCRNVNGINLLKENPRKIDWMILSSNPSAIELLKANPRRINWHSLCKNPNAIDMLEQEVNENSYKRISISMLATNPRAIHLLLKIYKKEPQIIDYHWTYLAVNPNSIFLFSQALDKYKYDDEKKCILNNPYIWGCLSRNPNAIELLKANPDKINWKKFSENPKAIDLLEKEFFGIKDKTKGSNIICDTLRFIYNGVEDVFCNLFCIRKKELLKRIDFDNLSLNPSIFVDYPANRIEYELIQYSLHPQRISKILELSEEDDYDIDYYI